MLCVRLHRAHRRERARLAGPRHFHLQLIGTDPREQRKGYGTQAIAHGLARADELGVPTYLESTNPDNQRFYVRQGFKALKEVRAPNGGPAVVLLRVAAALAVQALLAGRDVDALVRAGARAVFRVERAPL